MVTSGFTTCRWSAKFAVAAPAQRQGLGYLKQDPEVAQAWLTLLKMHWAPERNRLRTQSHPSRGVGGTIPAADVHPSRVEWCFSQTLLATLRRNSESLNCNILDLTRERHWNLRATWNVLWDWWCYPWGSTCHSGLSHHLLPHGLLPLGFLQLLNLKLLCAFRSKPASCLATSA